MTIHDAIHLTHPETLPRPRALAYAYAKVMLARAARVASRVIAVSSAAADDLGSELRIPPGKLTVIPNGIDEIFRPERPGPPSSGLADTATLIFPTSEKKKPIEGAVREPSAGRRGEAVDDARDGRPPAGHRFRAETRKRRATRSRDRQERPDASPSMELFSSGGTWFRRGASRLFWQS